MTRKRVFKTVAKMLEAVTLVEDDIENNTPLEQFLEDDDVLDELAYNLEDAFDLTLEDKLQAGYFNTVGELADYIWEEL